MQHIWIFQLKNALSAAEQAPLQQSLDQLTADWKAHGAPVPGQAEIRYDRFVIVQAAPGSTSGCSIDSMTRGVEALLAQRQAEVLSPNYIFYRNAEGALAQVDFREVAAAIAAGTLTADTVIYDSTLGQSHDLSRWEVKLSDSWLSRYLPVAK